MANNINNIDNIRDFFNSIYFKHKTFEFNIRNIVWRKTLRSVRNIALPYTTKAITNNRITIKDYIQDFEPENIIGYTVFHSVKKATKYYSDKIEHFKRTLEQNFEEEDLKLLHKNVDDILIKKEKKHSNITGVYFNGPNIIIIAKERALYHELFHMASSQADEYEGYFNSGFSFTDGIIGTEYGEALNEGYTELMANRFFNVDITAYKYQVEVCKQIEEIIGREKMQKIYLKGLPLDLESELSEYSSMSEAKEFVKKNDLFMKIQERNAMKKHLTEKDKEEYRKTKDEIESFIEKLKDKANINSNEVLQNNNGFKL